MKFFEAFGAKGYHTSVITTFGLDFDTYENVVLSRLRGAGCNNNLLVADHRMLALSLENPVALPVDAGRLYSVSGASAAAGGVYHPKVFVQIGRHKGRLIVASANMTAAGLSGNLEVVSEVLCDDATSAEQAAVVDAWSFVIRHLDREQVSISRQVRWSIDRAPWLRAALQRDPAIHTLASGNGEAQRAGASSVAPDRGTTSPRFFCTGGSAGIGAMFIEAVADEPVRRLVVVSPYWDDELRALDHLVRRLKPDSLTALIQKDQKLFPGPQASQVVALRVVDMVGAGVKGAASRFVHAKLIIAQTDDADHVLAGSANCTVAALGHESFSGLNEEASLYQRLAPGEMVKALEIASALDAQVIDAQELASSPRVVREEIELEHGRQLSPGRFELDQTTLSWWPGTATQASHLDSILIQLFDVEGVAVSIALIPLSPGSSDPHQRRYRLGQSDRAPRFASVKRPDGSESAMAVIGWADHLRHAAREARRGTSARIAQEIDDEEDSGLWLLDAIDRLEDAERAEQAEETGLEGGAAEKSGQVAARRSQGSRSGKEVSEYSDIAVSYEAFIAGRRPHADEFKVARSALGGSEVSAARMFMNRLLRMPTGMPWEPTAVEPSVEGVVTDKAGAEREVSESPAQADAGSGSVDAAQTRVGTPPPSAEEGDQPPPGLKVRKQVSAQEYRAVVEKFVVACADRSPAGTLGAPQALRLRVLLTVLVAAGCPRSERALCRGRKGLLKHQVLSIDGEYGWVRLVRILLFCFFGKSKALSRSFNLDASLEQVPDDFLELWATCFWVGISAAIAPQDEKPRELDEPSRKFLSGVYAATALRPQELRGDTVLMLLQRMNERYAGQIGVDGTELLKVHEQLIQTASQT